MVKISALVYAILAQLLVHAQATDRYFNDVKAVSPDGRYTLEAKSPDNKKGRAAQPFAGDFLYSLKDEKLHREVWQRRQSKNEGSCSGLHVDDDGNAVILTSGDVLHVVNLKGAEVGKIGILDEAITDRERKRYVSFTTAGPMWSGYSLWYFLKAEGRAYFVIKPWWGRRIIVDLETARPAREGKALAQAADVSERDSILQDLTRAVDTREQWESEDCCEHVWPVLTAAYHAGRSGIKEAAPLLAKLESSDFIGSSTSGGQGMGERFDGEVNPHSYAIFTLRQVAQLSLRRLGMTPQPLPATQFTVEYPDYKKHHPYTPKPTGSTRAANAGLATKGMKAERVLDLLGAPDFVGYDTWEFDIDARPSFTLVVTWDARRVVAVRKVQPARWKSGLTRDQRMVR